MSIMQEYGAIRKLIGEKEFSNIEKFLEVHPEYALGDVYYSKEVYGAYEQWKDDKQ